MVGTLLIVVFTFASSVQKCIVGSDQEGEGTHQKDMDQLRAEIYNDFSIVSDRHHHMPNQIRREAIANETVQLDTSNADNNGDHQLSLVSDRDGQLSFREEHYPSAGPRAKKRLTKNAVNEDRLDIEANGVQEQQEEDDDDYDDGPVAAV